MVTVIDEAFVFFQLQKADKHQGEKLQIILFSLILSVSFKVCFIFLLFIFIHLSRESDELSYIRV